MALPTGALIYLINQRCVRVGAVGERRLTAPVSDASADRATGPPPLRRRPPVHRLHPGRRWRPGRRSSCSRPSSSAGAATLRSGTYVSPDAAPRPRALAKRAHAPRAPPFSPSPPALPGPSFNENAYLSRSGFVDWLVGRQEAHWDWTRRWIHDYGAMGIRGLAWTMPAGHIMYHAGYSWQVRRTRCAGEIKPVHASRAGSCCSPRPFPSLPSRSSLP